MRRAAAAATSSAAASRDRVKAWVPGCKTGGLAYGVAMLLRECAAAPARPDRIQVFGTDDDEDALAFARAGRYPAGAALGLDPALRGRYTFDEGDTLRMAESLRESCVFAVRRLGQAAPLARMDLIVCHRVFDGVPASRRDAIVDELYAALGDDGVLLALDHRHVFPGELFELRPDGYLRPRSSRGRALRSYVQRAAEQLRSQRFVRDEAPAPDGRPRPEEERWPALRDAAAVLGLSADQTTRLARIQHMLRDQLRRAAQLVERHGSTRSAALQLEAGALGQSPPEGARFVAETPRSDARPPFLYGGGSMGELSRGFDWAATPLGPAAHWPSTLKAAVTVMLDCPSPALVWWGSELTQIYNDACIPLLGERHPAALGQPARDAWADVWPTLGARASAVLREGRAEPDRELPVVVSRRGALEEIYVSFSYGPVRDTAGRARGVFCSCTDDTQRVLERRRRRTLERLVDAGSCRSVADASPRVAAALAENPQDIPLAWLYLLDDEQQAATLAALHGLAQEPPAALGRIALERIALGAPASPWPLQRVLESREPALVEQLPPFLLGAAAEASRRPEQALVLPLLGAAHERLAGFLVVGLAPLRPLDDEYRGFLARVAKQAGAALNDASVAAGPSSEQRFRALVNASSYAVYRMSPDWSELRQLDGGGFVTDAQHPKSTWLDEYIDPRDRAQVVAAIERALSTRTPLELEHRVRRADGSIGWALSRAVPLFDARGETLEWIGAASDITARKAAEQALRESEARLLLADKAKDEFLATLGHELRTPLAALVLWASALRSGRVPAAELRSAIDAIVECAAAQSRLIDDLLDLSRLRAGKLLLDPVPVNLAAVVRAAVGVVAPTATAKGVALEVEHGEEAGEAVLDPARFRQVVWNLLSNAIKFTPAGGRVRLSVGKRGAELVVEVSDDGEGIPPELVPHLFDRFWQGEVREPRQHGGLGIGLALCRQLVELHGGTIGARSDGRGRGATFWLRMPHVVPPPSSEPRSEHVAGELTPEPRSLAGVTVLLVEDERNTLAAMQLTLESAGARVIPASAAAAALGLLVAAEADGNATVLVSELGLTGMSGLVLVQELAAARRSRGLHPLPACAVSAHARETDRQSALEAGFDMYLAKPVSPERLIEAVDDLRHVAHGEGPGADGGLGPDELAPRGS